jgi:hypothetical protein
MASRAVSYVNSGPLHLASNLLILNHHKIIPFTANPLIYRQEQQSLNRRVQGSSPCAPTKIVQHFQWLGDPKRITFCSSHSHKQCCKQFERPTTSMTFGRALPHRHSTFPYIRQAQASNSTIGATEQRTKVSDCRFPRRAVPASTIVLSRQGVSWSD